MSPVSRLAFDNCYSLPKSSPGDTASCRISWQQSHNGTRLSERLVPRVSKASPHPGLCGAQWVIHFQTTRVFSSPFWCLSFLKPSRRRTHFARHTSVRTCSAWSGGPAAFRLMFQAWSLRAKRVSARYSPGCPPTGFHLYRPVEWALHTAW